MAPRPSVDHDIVGCMRDRLERASPDLLHPADGAACHDPGHRQPVQVPGVADAKQLDELVVQFRNRPLGAGSYTFCRADAIAIKVREGGRVVNAHALIAVGVNNDGHLGRAPRPGRRLAATLPGASWQLAAGSWRDPLPAEPAHPGPRTQAGGWPATHGPHRLRPARHE